MIYSVFRHKRWAPVESLSLFLETRRPNAARRYQTLTQSLFERPTLNDEYLIAQTFRQPIALARQLLAKNRLYNCRFERRRNEVGVDTRVQHYCRNFEIPQTTEFMELVRKDSRSRIVTSFHFGDFLYGSAGLFALEARPRQQYVLSLNRSSEACYSNLAAGFGDAAPRPECELLHGEAGSQKLSQLLRAGDTSLLLFCDVPPGLNDTTEVQFLGRPAYFSVGPAVLALANRVPLLPLINYSVAGHGCIRLGTQIEPVLLHSETLRQAAQRITQRLVSFFECFFLERPEQWRFLPLLPCYFSESKIP